VHSQLNATRVTRIVSVDSLETIRNTIAQARRSGKVISIAGGRHAMGGQQFATDAVLLDTKQLNRVLHFDSERGTVEVESGIQWPELVQSLLDAQQNLARQWGIAQKQTGADRLSIGGALAANVHGRGLHMKPLIGDVESFTLLNARGDVLRCSRQENDELFRLVIGGYGLFGIVHSVTLRLVPRQKLQRVVEIISLDELKSAPVDKWEAVKKDADTAFGEFKKSVE
jgi:FAD/FMN-containing dehydrogenase